MDRIERTQADLDALAASGFCLGSRYYARAYDRARGEGLCAVCATYQPLDEQGLVDDHRAGDRGP